VTETDDAQFRRAMAQFATGITVVTTLDSEGRNLGLTVNAFSSVSLDPPLILVCIDNRSETHAGFESSGVFGVSVLAEDQEEWSRRFALVGPEKFDGGGFLKGTSGVALLPGALVHLECRVAAAYPGGDHTIYVGKIMSLAASPGRPLLYHGSAYGRLEDGARGR
jgi:flavin reductase (DIM6/NTAB) family NADH-FMN oxidoreductase RutF